MTDLFVIRKTHVKMSTVATQMSDKKSTTLSRNGQVDMEKCIDQAGGKYNLILIAAERARELARGSKSKVTTDTGKPVITALLEIQAGLVDNEEYLSKLRQSK